MKVLPKTLTFGSRVNRALRQFLLLISWLILACFIVGTAAFIVLFMRYDEAVTPQFENRRWALPARVYARPLELYGGAVVTQAQVIEELKLLHYQPSQRLERSGSYIAKEQQLDIYTRPFDFSDGHEPSRKLRLLFDTEGVSAITQLEPAEDLSLVRLEPAEIGAIYPVHNEDRILVKFAEIPEPLLDALIAMEDRAYFNHVGINPKAMLRAMLINFKAGRKLQGGSTLTQQLVKNYFLYSTKSYERKLQEIMYALVLDWRYSKTEILEAYANEIYLGQDGSRAIHGFGLASRFYFGRPLNELTLNDMALLVGIIPSPSAFNPRKHPERAKARRDLVLDVMAQRNLLSQADADKIKALPLAVLPQPPSGVTPYPAFLEVVHKQLKYLYAASDLATEGLKIFTTLDPHVQQQAEKALLSTLPILEKNTRQTANSLQGAVVVTKTQTGEIEALVGDRDVRRSGFNRALNAKRSIGSLIKPIVYLRALESPDQYSLATFLDDETPFSLQVGTKTWAPNNYDRRLHGWIPLITALAKSYNIPTVRLGLELGTEEILQTAYRLGLDPIEYPITPTPAILLGAIDMTPLDVTQIYSTIANGGYRTPLISIREVTKNDGTPLAQIHIEPVQAVYPAPNYLITRAMQEVVNAGTAGSIKSKIKTTGLAGKTGTTNDYRDSWFAGFSGDRVTTVWVGRDDNKPIRLSGTTGALKVWIDLMSQLKLVALEQTQPEDIVMRSVDISGGCGEPSRMVSLPFIANYPVPAAVDCSYQDYWDGSTDTLELQSMPANQFQESIPQDYQ